MKWLATALGAAFLGAFAFAGYIWMTTNIDAAGGKGWALIGSSRSDDLDFRYGFGGVPTGPPAAEAIFDPVNLGIRYSQLGLQAQPTIDFQSEIVLRAISVGSGSCPLHLDAVQLAEDKIVVETSSGFAMACSGDAVPYSFLLRIDRDQLPEWPLHVEVRSTDAVRQAEISPWARGGANGQR